VPNQIAIWIALVTGVFWLPGAVVMCWLSESRFLRYLQNEHHEIWLELGPHPSSGRNNTSAFFRFLSRFTAWDVPDAELWRLAKRVSRWLWMSLASLIALALSILAASVLS
jgi:hypothetical protein